MSFLDNLKKRKAEEAAAAAAAQQEAPAKKVNPLAALKAKAKKTEEAPAEEAPKKNSILERMKAKRKAEAVATEEAPAEETKEAKEVKRLSLQEQAEAVVAEKLAGKSVPADGEDPAVADAENEADKKAEEAEQDEAAVAETEEAKKAEAEETKEEATTEEEPEEKPKKRRRRKTAAKKEEEEEASAEPAKKADVKVHEYVNNYDILGKKVSYEQMAGAVMDYFIDDEWKATQEELTKKMNDIRIEPDMNPGTLKYALAELNNLNDEIALALIEQKQLLDTLTDKEFGAATALLAMNSRGSNAEERKANGFAALQHAKFGDDEEVNLIALINAVKARFAFLNSLSKRIQYKSNTCITMSGAMKMEQSLMTGAGVA